VLAALTVQLCEQFGVVPVAYDPAAKVLRVATADPPNADVQALEKATGLRIELAGATGRAATRRITPT